VSIKELQTLSSKLEKEALEKSKQSSIKLVENQVQEYEEKRRQVFKETAKTSRKSKSNQQIN